jgi:predicted Ser/Thr protein kinase
MSRHNTISLPAPLSRARLATLPRRPLRKGRNFTKAEVDLVDSGQRPIVIKDTARRPWAVRRLLGPWQLDREERAYRRLAGTPGVPELIGRPDRQALALQYIPGKSLDALRPGEVDGAFFDRLEALVHAIHGKGIAHGDLHHRDILRGPGGEPYVVDFATSVLAGPGANPLTCLLFEQMKQADLRAVAKLRQRLAPAPGRELPPRPLLYRLGSRFKSAIAATRLGRRDH